MIEINQPPFLDLHTIFDSIDLPLREPLIQAYVKNASFVATAPGSRNKHQNWKGGYLDHIVYAINYAFQLYDLHERLGFKPSHSKSDIAVILLLHDFGKIVKYVQQPNSWEYVLNHNQVEKEFLNQTIIEFKIKLNEEQQNALHFVHGEGDEYTPNKRLMGQLAVVCHEADVWSARYAPENPKGNGQDQWKGSFRHSEKYTNTEQYIQQLTDKL